MTAKRGLIQVQEVVLAVIPESDLTGNTTQGCNSRVFPALTLPVQHGL